MKLDGDRPLRAGFELVRPMVLAGGSRVFVLPLTAGVNLITAKLIFNATGPALYGIVLMLTTLTLLLPFSDLGVGAPVMTTIASRVALGDAEVRRVIGSAFRTLLVSSVLLLGAAFAILLTGLWPAVLGGTATALPGLAEIATAVVFLYAVGLPFSLGQRVLMGAGRMHLAVLSGATGPLAGLALAAAAVAINGGPGLVALALPAGALVMSIFTLVIAGRVTSLPLGRILAGCLSPASRASHLSLRDQATPMLILSLALPLALQTDRVILSHFANAAALTAYGVASLMYAPAFGIAQTSATPLWPMAAERRSLGLSNQRLWTWATWCFLALGSGLGVILIVVGPEVARWLLGRVTDRVDPLLWIAFGLLLAVQAAAMPTSMFLTTARSLRFQASMAVSAATANILLSIVLARHMGAPGPVVASVAASLGLQLIPGLIYVQRRGLGSMGTHERFR